MCLSIRRGEVEFGAALNVPSVGIRARVRSRYMCWPHSNHKQLAVLKLFNIL